VFHSRYVILIRKGINIALSEGETVTRNTLILQVIVIVDFRSRFYVLDIALTVLVLVRRIVAPKPAWVRCSIGYGSTPKLCKVCLHNIILDKKLVSIFVLIKVIINECLHLVSKGSET
jgi:hypothetical protein